MDNSNNCSFDKEKLLSDKRVIAEIERHLWLESEKAGRNIGFEKAKESWLKNFALAWIQYHMPEALTPVATSAPVRPAPAPSPSVPPVAAVSTPAKSAKPARAATIKRRRAKSYL